jgi:hypothetical protein
MSCTNLYLFHSEKCFVLLQASHIHMAFFSSVSNYMHHQTFLYIISQRPDNILVNMFTLSGNIFLTHHAH